MAERPRAQAHVAAGVHDVDVDAILGRALVAHLLEPGGHAPAAARGGDDEVGAQLLLLAAGRAVAQGHPAHPATVVHQARDARLLAHADVGDRGDATADDALEERAAGEGARPAGLDLADEAAPDVEAHVDARAPQRRAGLRRLVGEAGEEALDRHLAAGLQPVGMAPLRDRATVLVQAHRKRVTIEHGDAVIGVREDAGGQQAGHARADDDRVLPTRGALRSLLALR